MGLITRAVPAEQLDAEVARALAAIRANAPLALRLGRLALAEAETMDWDAAVEHLCGKLGELLQTEDAVEGLTAFAEKRAPRWKGR
jgi:enoyl-CoA hydratase/carnithine racemase